MDVMKLFQKNVLLPGGLDADMNGKLSPAKDVNGLKRQLPPTMGTLQNYVSSQLP